MRTTRTLLPALALLLLAACGSEPTASIRPGERPSLDGGGYMGSGHRTDSTTTTVTTTDTDSTTTRDGGGYVGSGN